MYTFDNIETTQSKGTLNSRTFIYLHFQILGLEKSCKEKDIKKAKSFFATGLLFYILPTPHVVKNGIVKSM